MHDSIRLTEFGQSVLGVQPSRALVTCEEPKWKTTCNVRKSKEIPHIWLRDRKLIDLIDGSLKNEKGPASRSKSTGWP